MMRKIIILLSLMLFTMGVMAQEVDMLSKRGEEILPKEGDFALGIDAHPIMQYFGNIFGMASSNFDGSFDFLGSSEDNLYQGRLANTIYLKYYLEDQTAIRLAFRLGLTDKINREFAIENQVIVDPLNKVTDVHQLCHNFYGLGGDYLMYRGKGRVQGYFGAGAFVYYTKRSNIYKYGNEYSTAFNNPQWNDFASHSLSTAGQRPLYDRATTLGISLRAIVGVEYFFAPKISIGGEMGLGFDTHRIKGVEKTETWNVTETKITTTDKAKDGYVGIDNFATGNLFIMFHF